MARILYCRVSTRDQSVEAQRIALGGAFDREFRDNGVSGAVRAIDRPGFAALHAYAREGDEVHVYAVDRLGRDALDVQTTVRDFIARGIAVHILGLGVISKGVGELVLAVLAQVASMERDRIQERCDSGRVAARAALRATGKTHRGKDSLGRPKAHDAAIVRAWRKDHEASIATTAKQFGIGSSTVKRYCAES